MIQQIFAILDEGHEGEHMADGLGMMGIFGGGWWMWLMMIAGVIIVPLLTLWAYQDAKRLGENAALWAMVVFFTMGFGIILYALIRNPERSIPAASGYSSPPQPASINPTPTVTYSSPAQYNPNLTSNDTSRFCEYCGAPRAVTDNYCPKCGKAVG
ncbi:MAG: hypothetical protein ACXAC8_07710 [Candidatus Hodarchaeales archaeon]|jgi:hypothetical protein